jgi:hypothetical protein
VKVISPVGGPDGAAAEGDVAAPEQLIVTVAAITKSVATLS